MPQAAAHQGLRQHIKEVAKKHYISVQWDTTTGGGTDAGSIHVANEGIQLSQLV